MEAPRCIVCGTKHWSRQFCPALAGGTVDQRQLRQAPPIAVEGRRLEIAREAMKQAETEKTSPSVTKKAKIPVTKNQPSVTKIAVDGVTKIPTVTKTKRGRPRLGDKPMTAAERMRRYRASKAPLP